MGIDAGTVYAEIRVALDKLQHDVNEANLLFVDLGKNVDKQNQQTANSTQSMSKKISSAFQNMSKNGVNQFARLAQGINSAFTDVKKSGKGSVAGVAKHLEFPAGGDQRIIVTRGGP